MTPVSFISNGMDLLRIMEKLTNQQWGVMWHGAGKAGGNKNTFNVDDVGYATAAAAGLDGGDHLHWCFCWYKARI